MSLDPHAVDRQRKHWRRARAGHRLNDPTEDDFGSGGLAERVEDPRVRILLLPDDPEEIRVVFDDSFWQWWRGDHPDPTSNQPARWGNYSQPTSDAAVRSSLIMPGQKWRNYLAIHRSGAIEAELGRYGGAIANAQRGTGGQILVFRLVTIVGLTWAALALYDRVREWFGIDGPTELTVSLRATAGAFLGDFGQGWSEPWDYNHETPPQLEKNLQLRRELREWPGSTLGALAMNVGEWLEDAWGNTTRRYRAARGPMAGQSKLLRFAGFSST